MRPRCAAWLAGCALLLLTACSTFHYPTNELLTQHSPNEGYRFSHFIRTAGDEELLVVMTFSGGGSRAAALGLGVLQAMADTPIQWRGQRKRLLDEVDLVYGVSGGSILAAYYGWAGDRVLTEFGPKFLERNVQGQLIDNLTTLSNLWRIGSPWYGRGELLQKALSDSLFDGLTFKDLKDRRAGPFAVISAADLSSGARFAFTQETFDLICSRLDSFPLARAVAASSSVPLVFAPITLKNYAGSCNYTAPALLLDALRPKPRPFTQSRREVLAEDLAAYLDASERPYVHLIDGGVADNLAVRGLLEVETLIGDGAQVMQTLQLQHTRKVVLIVVDAGAQPARLAEKSDTIPRVGLVAESLGDILVGRYSQETRQLILAAFNRWKSDARAVSEKLGLPIPEFYFIDVSLGALQDTEKREMLIHTPTTLYLEKDRVRALEAAGDELLRQSADYKRLVKDLNLP